MAGSLWSLSTHYSLTIHSLRVFGVQKGDRASERRESLAQDGLSDAEEERCIEDEQSDGVHQDGHPRKQRDRTVLRRLIVALDRRIRLQVIGEIVAVKECVCDSINANGAE